MESLHITSASEQTAHYLREQLIRQAWVDTMPGGPELASQLGVGRMTIEAALSMLESEGLLVPQGPGRRRRIELPERMAQPVRMRVAILLYEASDQSLNYLIDSKNKLEAAGHSVFYAPGSLTEIKMDVKRLARMVEKTEADAWVVAGGTREVLQWFTQQKPPVFALFGRRRELKIAGISPDHRPAIVEATRRLIELGHQRIVFLDSLYNVSNPGAAGTAFLDALSAGGITAGAYNLPGWEGGIEGLYAFLDSSFQRTSPTALIASSSPSYFATQSFLLNRGIRVPQDCSLVCVDDDPYFSECQPPVSHIRWSRRPLVNRIVRWVKNVSQGKEDTRQTEFKAEFVEGGTIGVARES
jgi:DNA-binding LacI/PurR family transcriptional regulator/biotin operon repressor